MTSGKSLNNRIALVTGASAGIGRAIARDLALRGCRLVINARRSEPLRELAAALSANGASCAIAPGDAADQNVIDSMFAASRSAFGADPDAVIVNAGRGLNGSVVTSDPSQWEEMIRTNLLGAARLIRSASASMLACRDRDGASWQLRALDIVVIGSIVGRHVSPFSSMYGGTKFGVHGMTEGVRRELAPKGVRVTLVEPGFVVSEFQGVAGYKPEWFQGVVEKIGPVLQPEDVARPIGFVLEQPAHVHVSDFIVRPTRQDYP